MTNYEPAEKLEEKLSYANQLQRPILTPSDIANYVYCPRLFQLSRLVSRSSPGFDTIWGLFEHDVFRLLMMKFTSTWLRDTEVDSIAKAGREQVEETLTYAYDLAIQNYPHFAFQIKGRLPEFRHRLFNWINLKQQLLNRMMARGLTFDQAIARLLPWKIEDKLFSKNFGLSGRTDALYYDGNHIVAEDIKTHDSKFDTYLKQQSHRMQLTCYAAMAQEAYSIPCKETRIFYSRDLTYARFSVSRESISELAERCSGARELLSSTLTPMLKGEEAIKCQNCYLRKLCFEIEDQQNKKPSDQIQSGQIGGDLS